MQGGRITADADQVVQGWAVEAGLYITSLGPQAPIDGVFLVNHSCAPNCGFRGQLTLVSLHDIAAGTELTYDYAMSDDSGQEDWDSFSCHCGSADCRHVITFKDWRLPSLQARYKGFFSTYIQSLIDRAVR